MKKNLLRVTVAALSLFALTACGGGTSEAETASTQSGGDVTVAEQSAVAQPAAEQPAAEQPATDSNPDNDEAADDGQQRRFGFDSQYLTTDYDGATSVNNQLLIGTLELEGTEQAVTAEQAAKLLPFWIALQSGAITNQAESNAVLKQIEGTMSEAQMQTIANLKLTNESIGEWAEANGVELPQGGPGGGAGGPGGPGAAGGPLADMTEDERAAFREELQSLSDEERQARLAELGIEFGGRQGGGGDGQGAGNGQGGGGQGAGGRQGDGGQGGRGFGGGRLGILMEPLIEMLTERASG